MKAVLNETKRILAVMLSVAMIIAAVPQAAFAAPESPSENELEDATVQEEEIVNTESQKELQDDNSDGDIVTDDDLDSKGDVIIKIVTKENVKVLDPKYLNEGLEANSSWSDYRALVAANNHKDNIEADSVNGYSFIVAPNDTEGKELKSTFILAGDNNAKTFYKNYTGFKEYNASGSKWVKEDDSEVAEADVPKTGLTKVDSASGIGYTVTDFAPVKEYKVVTLTPALLQDVIAKFKIIGGEWSESAKVDGATAKKAALDTRPVLTIELDTVQSAKFKFNQPTTKGSVEMIETIADTDLSQAGPAAIAKPGAGNDEQAAIANVALIENYQRTNSLKDAKITMTITKDGQNISGIDGLSIAEGSTNLAVFPYTIKGSEYIGSTITGTEIQGDAWTGTDPYTQVHKKAVPFVFNTNGTTGTLYVSQYIINAAYYNGYSIDVAFDFSEDVSTEYNLSVDGMSGEYVIAEDGKTKLAKVEKTVGVPFVNKVKGTETAQIFVTAEKDSNNKYREVSNVYYTVGTSQVKKKTTDLDSDAKTWTASLKMSDVNADVKFYVETSELISIDTDTKTDFAIYDEKGKKVVSDATRIPSGKPFKFTVHAKNGKDVGDVFVKIGGKKSSALEEDEDGYYTTDSVINALEIQVEEDTVLTTYDVSRKANITGVDSIKTTDKTVEETINSDSRIDSVFYGDLDEFAEYWNDEYGTSYTGSGMVTAGFVGSDVVDGNFFAFTIKWADDMTGKSVGHTGIKITNGGNSYWGLHTGAKAAGTTTRTLGYNGTNKNTFYQTTDWLKLKTGDTINYDTTATTLKLQPFYIDSETKAASVDLGDNWSTNGQWTEGGSYDGTGATTIGSEATIEIGGEDKHQEITSPAAGTYGKDAAIFAQPYYFDIAVENGRMVTDVSYTVHGDSETYKATFVRGDKYKDGSTVTGVSTWKTAPVTDDIEIDAKTSAYSIVKLDGKSNVVATTSDGTEITDEGIAVDNTKDLQFTIAGIDENTKVTKVSYLKNAAGPEQGKWEPESTPARYTIPAADVDDGTLVIMGYTEETVTDPYSVEFKNGTETGKKETDQLKNVYDAYDNLKSQSLTVGLNERTKVTTSEAIIKDKDGNVVPGTTQVYKVSKVKDAKILDGYPRNTYVDAEGYVTTGKDLFGIKAGTQEKPATDKITVEARLAEDGTNNVFLYTADLPVTVVSQYDDLELYSSSDAIDTGFEDVIKGDPDASYIHGNGAELCMRGKSVRTGKYGRIYAGDGDVKKIKWSIVENGNTGTTVNPKYGFLKVAEGGTSPDEWISYTLQDTVTFEATDDGAWVRVFAKNTDKTSITVKAEMYGDEDVLIASKTKTLNIVEAADYVVIPYMAVAGGRTLQGSAACSTYEGDGDDLLMLETAASGQKTATISYKVYKKLVDTATIPVSWNSDDKQIKKAIDKGELAEVTTGITYKAELNSAYYDDDSEVWREYDDEDGVTPCATLTGTASPFTVTATKKTDFVSNEDCDAEIAEISVAVNGVTVDWSYYGFRVVDRIVKNDVEFSLNGVQYAADGKYVDATDDTKTVTASGSGKTVVRMLSSAYLNQYTNKKSEVLAFSKEYTTGVMLTDVTAGTKITLPTENDFTTANKDPRAVLVGWKATGGNVYLASDLTTAHTGFAPGAEVVVNPVETTKLTFTAVWAPKYYLATLTGGLDASGSLIVGGKKWTTTAGDALTWEAGYIANGVKTEAYKYLDPTEPEYDGTTETTKYDIYKTKINKAALRTNLDTALYAFTPYGIDATTGSIMVMPVNVKAGYTIDNVATSASKDNLNFSGTKISGRAEGTSGDIVATLTENSTTWEFPGEPITVGAAVSYAGAFNNGKTGTGATGVSTTTDDNGFHSITNPLTKLTLQKSQSTKTISPFILAGKDAAASGNSGFTFEYTLKSGDSFVTATKNVNNEDVDITPKAIGTAKLSTKVTDETGKSFTIDDLTIEVVEDAVVIDVTGTDKTAPAFDGKGLGASATGIEFCVAAYAKTDTAKATKLSGTWGNVAIDGDKNKVAATVAADSATKSAVTDGTNRTKFTFSTAGKDLGTDNIGVTFTYGTGDEQISYTKNVEVTTHYNLVLSGAVKSDTAEETFITVSGERQLDKDAMKEATHTRDLALEPVEIPVTVADQKGTGTADDPYTYDVDLSKYDIELIDTVAKKNKVLAYNADYWFYPGSKEAIAGVYSVNTDASKVSKKLDDYATNDVTFKDDKITGLTATLFGDTSSHSWDKAGSFIVRPQKVPSPITKATPVVSSITLENSTGKEYKDVDVNVLPVGTVDKILVIPEHQGFFQFVSGKANDAGWLKVTKEYNWTAATTATDFATAPFTAGLITATSGTDSRTDTFSVGMVTQTVETVKQPKAGTTTLKLYDESDAKKDLDKATALATITLNVNGLNYVDEDVMNYIENGEIVKGDIRTVGDETYIFDENGNMKKDSGIVTLKDGKKVLVLDGKLAHAGVRAYGTDSYIVDANGVILSGWQTFENNSYYADPANENKLVDGLVKIGDKSYYFKSYALQKAKNTKGEYEFLDSKYFVNAEGEAAVAMLFPATIEGVTGQYLADEKGELVTYDKTTGGKITINGVGYVVSQTDNTAAYDDVLYAPSVKFNWPKDYTKGTTMTVTWEGTVKSKNDPKTPKEIKGTATVNPTTVSAGNADKKVEFTATADLSAYWKDEAMSAKAENKSESKTYNFKNGGVSGNSAEYNFDDDAEEDGTLTVVFAESGDKTLETPYTGYPIKPQVIVTNGDRTLVEGVDYSVSYKNNTNVKNKEATKAVVKGKGKYSDTIDMPFTIAPVDLASDEVVVGGTVFKSNVADKNIKPVVTYKGKIRTLNKDYAISLGSWTAAEKESFATLTLSAGTNGNFTGTKEVGVTKMDNPPKVKVTKFTAPAATYRGEDEPWVLTSENLTMQGVDAADFDEKVNLTYSNNVNAGTCKVTITVEGQSGKATKSFKIKPNTSDKLVATNGQDLKDTGVKYVNTGAQPYVAIAVDSSSESTLAGTELVYGRDYTLKWSNNKKVANSTESKAPTYKINFVGNFKGNKTLKSDTFTITQTILADNEVVVSMPETVAYGTSNKASKYFLTVGKNLVVTVNGVVLKKSEFIVEFFKEGTETALTKNDTVAAGDKIGVRIIPKGAKMTALYGDKAYTAPDTYEIVDKGSKKDLGKNKIKFLQPNGSKEKTASIGYTGVAITLDLNKLASDDPKQAFIAMYDGKEKVELNETDYKIEYANNVNKGTATVIITATDSNEKYAGSVAANFKIKSGSVKTIEVKE